MPPQDPRPAPRLLAGKEVGEDAVHVFPKGRAGAAHVRAPRLQRATWEPLGAGLGLCQEVRLRPVQWAASGWGPRRGTATSALQGPWKQTRHIRGAGRAMGWLGAKDGPSAPDSGALCSSVKRDTRCRDPGWARCCRPCSGPGGHVPLHGTP